MTARCPDCSDELQSARVQPIQPGVNAYVVILECPSFEHHNTTVACAHGCGQQVPYPRAHYSFTPGLLGSGKWSCFKFRPKLVPLWDVDQPNDEGNSSDEQT